MLEKWFEPGLGKHIVESLQLAVESEDEFSQIQKEITEMDSLLKKYGMKLSLSRNKEDKFTFKFEISLDRLKRAAGKKVSEVFLFSSSHKSSETAEYAGVQLRTYQRRVKRYKEESRWNEENSSFF